MNSIRTPKQGVTANSRRIAQAVDNEDWQKVRLSMKGISTDEKIKVLEKYWEAWGPGGMVVGNVDIDYNDVVVIRIDNYIKALCRGGQLAPGMTFDHLIDGSIRNHIRK